MQICNARQIPNDPKFEVILARWGDRLVTWVRSRKNQDNRYWGHYFSENQVAEAKQDFVDRCASYGIQVDIAELNV